MNYLLDTNIILIYIRARKTRDYIEQIYNPFDKYHHPMISVVSVGEIKAIALKNAWGKQKIKHS